MGTSRYLLEHTSTKSFDGKLLYVSHSKYENDWPSLVHSHPFSELFYVKKGRGAFLVEDEEFPIKEDDFVIVNANTPHTEISSGEEPLEYVIIGVEELNFSIEGNKEHIIFSCGSEQRDLMFYMTTMLKEMTEKPRDYERVCQDLLEVLIIRLIRRTNFAFSVDPALQISRECLKLKRYLEANYMSNISLDSLAEISHLNKYYMVHAFTKYCGVSPISYLCQIRIQASKELLANTDYSITEVAHSSGFSSQSYFAQCFQKSCGMTASAYRKANRQ